jgi:hypothetical protein
MKKKELKIRFHHDDKGYCREFWEIFPEDNQKQPCFIIRDTSGPGGSWRIASGEFYEPSFEVADEITLILCNSAWQEHLRIGNDRGRFPVGFPMLQEACREAWNDFAGKPARLLDLPDFWRWFAPYCPQELPSWEQDNYRDNNRRTVNREILARFDFCGDELQIIRTTERHTECDFTWRKYLSYAMFYGYEVGNYVIDTNPLRIANLPWRETGMTITAKDLRAFNAMIGKAGKALYCSHDPKVRRLVELLKEHTARQNKGLKPTIDKEYTCETCGSRSGKCHPTTGYCFVCGTDNWKPAT